MMYCLRTFLPLLLLPLPLALSPIHLTTFLFLTYVLNRPCAYCSLLLIILFASSCHWSGRCFWATPFTTDLSGTGANITATSRDIGWSPYFLPRLYTTPQALPGAAANATATDDDLQSFLVDITNSTLSALASSAVSSASSFSSDVISKHAPSISIPPTSLTGGVGTQWLRNLMGGGEWTLPCVGVKFVL